MPSEMIIDAVRTADGADKLDGDLRRTLEEVEQLALSWFQHQ